ncbi:MAG: hypothetical protein KGM17_11685 [Sphingomonadales bacterium]|nr:hypothetical protein [Sphingomonadales bacterium]
MEMLMPPPDWQGDAAMSPLPAGRARALDWQGLAARLAAAAACRDAAMPAPRAIASGLGSFDPASARRLVVVGETAPHQWVMGKELRLSAVNPTLSVEVKPGAAIGDGTAGTVQTGDRGLQ